MDFFNGAGDKLRCVPCSMSIGSVIGNGVAIAFVGLSSLLVF